MRLITILTLCLATVTAAPQNGGCDDNGPCYCIISPNGDSDTGFTHYCYEKTGRFDENVGGV